MKFTVEKDTLEKVLNYLSTKPWREVNELVALLSKVEPVKEQPEE